MATTKNSSTAAILTEPSSTRPRRLLHARMVQNFHLVWLDRSIDEVNNDDCRNSITKLRQVVNTVNTFINVDECIDFINNIKEEKAFLISSGALGETTVPVVHDKPQVSTIFIFCGNRDRHEKWAIEWPKVQGVYTDITPICEALKQAARDCDHNAVSISFVKSTDAAAKENLDQLDSSFMYTQILKEILLTIDFEEKHIKEFLAYCREQLAGNTIELVNVDKIQKEYRHHQPIWWYTYECFLYSMLNRALRMMEADRIIKMGFFVRDLHNHIAALYAEQYDGQNHSNSFTVYRGQGLSQTDFEQLMKTQGGLLSFNNFLSTSKNRNVSQRFAERTATTSNLIGVLFILKTDPSISATPFANVGDVSYFTGEEEILFSMHAVFRIGQVKQIDGNDRLWEVDLILTGDNDPQLHILAERMREETQGSTGWIRLGKIMIKLGHYNEAEDLHNVLLAQTTDEKEKGDILYQLGCIKCYEKQYADAIIFYENSLKIREKIFTSKHPAVADCYNDIGIVYKDVGQCSKALSYHEKALKIRRNTLSENHPDLATSYNNIGAVYDKMGQYSEALSYYKKNLEICQKTLPPNHPNLATSYSNIGTVYYNMGEHSKTLTYYEKALEIRQKSLPENHSSLATSYSNIVTLYEKMGEHSKTLTYYEKALEIRQKTLPENDSSLAISYHNIGEMCDSMGEYSKALSYYEKALEIQQKTFPENHPSLATSYNNIGGAYYSMGEYSKALLYYEKALEIREKTLPANHPSLVTFYNNTGRKCDSMKEYSKAVSYYEKALEIQQKILPENHLSLANSYNNIGTAYCRINEYSKTLSSYERTLDIRQRSLPPTDPSIKTVRNSIEVVKKKL